jgi:RES domain-containing protein
LVSVYADVPADLAVAVIEVSDLPRDWRALPAPESLAGLGMEWLQSAETALLEVPSAVIPQESNYLINPAHPDFSRIEVGDPEPFVFDSRMWRGR